MFETYTAPEFEDSDKYPPKDNYGRVLIIKVKDRKEGIVTEHSPEGGPGVIVDVVDVGRAEIFRNVLWMGGPCVDGLSQYAGRGPLVIKFEQKTAKTGRKYPSPAAASEAEVAQAQAYITQHGDPFLPQLATTTTAAAAETGSKPPF